MFAVGAAAGWFAAEAGRARCPQRADASGLGEVALPTAQPDATAKPKRKATDRSAADRAELAALRRRMEELEREYTARAGAIRRSLGY